MEQEKYKDFWTKEVNILPYQTALVNYSVGREWVADINVQTSCQINAMLVGKMKRNLRFVIFVKCF